MKQRVSRSDNLFDYFNDKVSEASVGSPICDDTRLYMASLLTERARTDRPVLPETTLAELHARAAHAPPAQQASAYRELGDRALYAVGYFEESLDRKIVGRAYYEEMGSAAYSRVDAVFKRWFRDAFGPVFAELAGRFHVCVDVLASIRREHATDPLLQLYDQWLETGDEDTAEQLRSRGLLVPRGPAESC